MYVKLASATLVAAVLSGCAVGQKFSYSDSSIVLRRVYVGHTTAVAVLDQRKYVKNGNKSESFVGLSRGGYGNPFDVDTKSGAPMAFEMAMSIAAALEVKGLRVQTVTVRPADGFEGARQALVRTGSSRNILFTVDEWKTDTMMRTGLDFDVTLDVFDSSGNKLAQNRLYGKEISGGSILSAEKDARAWFAAKVSELFHDEAIEKALH
ncbi:MAG: hypothetical protein AB7N91_12910 [Candidatus Tectimicrobiota bacterium]